MGFVGSILGGGGGSKSAGGFEGSGTTSGELNNAYGQTQDAIARQRQFVDMLAGQNGLGNQNLVFSQQQALANQLQGVANGTGPNPAQAQLAQNTAANTANQAALMAGQRGSSQNTGMMARQAAMQGAQNQQNSVGQAATLQAQQQMAAMQQLQNQQTSMGNLANTQVGQQQAGISAFNNNALQQQSNLIGMQSNMNNVNAGIAQGNQRGQQNIIGGMMGGIGSAAQMFARSGGGGGGGADNSTMPLIGSQMGADSGAGGAMLNGAGSTLMEAEGGEIPEADPIESNPLMQTVKPQEVAPVAAPTGPQSAVGKIMSPNIGNTVAMGAAAGGGGGMGGGDGPNPLGQIADTAGMKGSGIYRITHGQGDSFGDSVSSTLGGGDAGHFAGEIGKVYSGMAGMPDWVGGLKFAPGGKVPALVSPGEQYIPPNKVKEVAKGKKSPLKTGERIPGKPKHPGNDYRNDTVKRNLDEGGIVIPNKIMQSKDAEKQAIAFVRDIIAKNRLK